MGSGRFRHGRDRADDLQQVREPLVPFLLSIFHFLPSLFNREVSQLTGSISHPIEKYINSSNDFYEIMDMLDKRLNDKGKNWRHVLKSLKVLDYCLHEGSELVVTWARKNVYIIKTLREFQYIDEDGRDVGQNGALRSFI